MEFSREQKIALQTAKRTNYLNPNYEYLHNLTITEWDIKSAGFSVLKFQKLLPEDELKELEKLDKYTRTVKEGLLQKSRPEVASAIITTLEKVRQAYILINNILDDEILSIKKDAIFLINHNPEKNTIKDYFVFRKKNTYTSYILLNGKEFYYNGGTDVLDIKGIPTENIEKCNDHFLKDIKKFLRFAEILNKKDLFLLLKKYREKYLSRQLPIETYRELDSGQFRLNEYMANNITADDLEGVDISQNYINYILPLIKAVM